MKKLHKAVQDFKSLPKILNPRLVWNPNPFLPTSNPWLTTVQFSTDHIKSRGLEVVCG